MLPIDCFRQHIEILDLHTTPTEFEKSGGIGMAINIASLRDFLGCRLKLLFQTTKPGCKS